MSLRSYPFNFQHWLIFFLPGEDGEGAPGLPLLLSLTRLLLNCFKTQNLNMIHKFASWVWGEENKRKNLYPSSWNSHRERHTPLILNPESTSVLDLVARGPPHRPNSLGHLFLLLWGSRVGKELVGGGRVSLITWHLFIPHWPQELYNRVPHLFFW